MSVALKISLSPEAEKIVTGMQTLPARMVLAIARGMDQGNQLAIAQIQRFHLTGTGPFPPEQHKLGKVTSRLLTSVNASPAKPVGNIIQTSIGSNVVYAAIHEFGGRIHHKARQVKVRHRLNASGNLVKQLKNSNLLMFAKKGGKRVREQQVEAKEHDVVMPERAPFRTGLSEAAPKYKSTVSAAILAEWEKMK